MTPIISDIRILDNLLALNLNVSLWSARRKMSQEDLGGAELPPEDLASLGSKRIADPENLKVFGTLKARAFNYLDRHGVRFMASVQGSAPKTPMRRGRSRKFTPTSCEASHRCKP